MPHEIQRRILHLPNGVDTVIVKVPGGTGTIGSPPDEVGRWPDETQRSVTVQEFWMWETDVTQREWQAVMGNNPSYFRGDDLPVDSVSWDDSNAFCAKIRALVTEQYPDLTETLLPSDEEYEYACRAGETGPLNVPGATLDQVAWHHGNSEGKTHPVKQKLPNAWGLFDMLGNVCKWTRTEYVRKAAV
jgi:formylglycine-generating enzyme required for sulfatase activity